jgi:hypothetical protein
MFVQVIEGPVSDPQRLRRQLDAWDKDLRPGAAGFLGSTTGVTDDGYAIAFVRFESAAAAKANSDRPEQGEWWSETEKCFSGDVKFTESEEVETFLGGGSNDAGFVQVMKGTADREQMGRLDGLFEKHAASFRPDLLGGLHVWTGNTFIDANYFTSEADARAGEGKEPPPELAEATKDFDEVMADVEFLDLRHPWLY